MTEMTFWGFYR